MIPSSTFVEGSRNITFVDSWFPQGQDRISLSYWWVSCFWPSSKREDVLMEKSRPGLESPGQTAHSANIWHFLLLNPTGLSYFQAHATKTHVYHNYTNLYAYKLKKYRWVCYKVVGKLLTLGSMSENMWGSCLKRQSLKQGKHKATTKGTPPTIWLWAL